MSVAIIRRSGRSTKGALGPSSTLVISTACQAHSLSVLAKPSVSDRIIGVHGEVERISCAGRAGEEEDHAGTKAARHLGYAIVPDRIASDVERRCTVGKAHHEANHVAG